jgi:hypothetical protein
VTDPRLLRPTFRKCDLPEPPAEVVKRYKAYLTRVSKWRAWKESNDDGLIKQAILRSTLVGHGEIPAYLDDAWGKRVFGDKEFFEDAGDGFWRVIPRSPDDAPSEPSGWEGVRPGEDVLGTALARAADAIGRRSTADLNLRSRFLDEDPWDPVHRDMLACLDATKKRGIEKPLNDLQERSFQEALLDGDWTVQVVAMWLLNTRQLVDVMQRMLAVLKGEPVQYQPYELVFWGPNWTRAALDEKGEIVPLEEAPTPQRTLDNVRMILLNRGILSGKKQ